MNDEILGCDSCTIRQPSERLIRRHILELHMGNATPLILKTEAMGA